MTDKTIAMRHKARRLALQALYQWEFSEANLHDIEVQFHTFNNMQKVDAGYFHELLHNIPSCLDEIDAQFESILDRSIKELNPIERSIIRIGTYELSKRPDIPYRVVIDEALRLAKTFGSEEGYKYVNAILDKVARQCRVNEISNSRR